MTKKYLEILDHLLEIVNLILSIDKVFVNVAARPPVVVASFLEAPSPILATLRVTLVYVPPHSFLKNEVYPARTEPVTYFVPRPLPIKVTITESNAGMLTRIALNTDDASNDMPRE